MTFLGFEESKVIENLTGALNNAALAIRSLEEAQKRANGYYGNEVQAARSIYQAIATELEGMLGAQVSS